ncbi:MAG TPA: hypothetical protein VG294_04725 [Solirubrobacteraceae bacterium]|jgi:hypothetical protein|nr:hypothetical protein [Solirubrobacteraceae bacterium]
MASTSQRGSANRTSSNGNSAAKARSGTRGRNASASRAKPARTSNSKPHTAAPAKKAATDSNRVSVTSVAIPAVTAALGVAGGVLLGRTALRRNHTLLGVPVPGMKVDLSNISSNIGDAARQFGRLAREVQVAREKAEQVARALG